MLFHHPADAPLAGFDLPTSRTEEIQLNGDLWNFMPDDDRHVLLDAGLQSPSMSFQGRHGEV